VALYRTGQFAEAVPVLERSLREGQGQSDAFEFGASSGGGGSGGSSSGGTSTEGTSIAGLSVTDKFALTNQTETVSGTMSGASAGQVTISDGGANQTVGMGSNGSFSATFTFNLSQEFSTAKAHSVSVSYGGTTVGSTTFSPSTGSTNSGNNTSSLLFQLIILESILSALGI
jgi:hypothetical protein